MPYAKNKGKDGSAKATKLFYALLPTLIGAVTFAGAFIYQLDKDQTIAQITQRKNQDIYNLQIQHISDELDDFIKNQDKYNKEEETNREDLTKYLQSEINQLRRNQELLMQAVYGERRNQSGVNASLDRNPSLRKPRNSSGIDSYDR